MLLEVSEPALRHFLEHTIFPNLRVARIKVIYDYFSHANEDTISHTPSSAATLLENITVEFPQISKDSTRIHLDFSTDQSATKTHAGSNDGLLLSVGTNLLTDIVAVPTLSLEAYLGNNWSVRADGMYAWWSRRASGRYWRLQGATLTVRKYFRTAESNALYGHHAGLFGGILRYDFCLGNKGVLSGGSDVPFTTRPSWCAGIEYGYSMALSSRLRLDLSVGIGYLWGVYMRYRNENGHSIWESTHRRNWFGPVKAEVSLSWIIGKGGGQ